MFDLNRLILDIKKIGSKINAPESLLNIRTSPLGDGTPHLEITDDKISYVYTERGIEYNRVAIYDIEDLLYIFFKAVTMEMARAYELENRDDGQDFRRVYFAKHLELMRKISAEWAAKAEQEIIEILKKSPFEDNNTKLTDKDEGKLKQIIHIYPQRILNKLGM